MAELLFMFILSIAVSYSKLVNLISGKDKSLTIEDTEEMSPEEMMSTQEKTAQLNNSFANGDMKSKSQQKKNDVKRTAAKNNPRGKDMSGY